MQRFFAARGLAHLGAAVGDHLARDQAIDVVIVNDQHPIMIEVKDHVRGR